MVRTRGFVLALAALAGCRAPVGLVSGPSDVLAIWATLDDAQQVKSVQVRQLIPGARTDLSIDGEAAVVWTFAAGELVDPTGLDISPDDRRLHLRRVGDDPLSFGSCQRCLLPATNGVQVLGDGDSCSPPSFARAQRVEREGVSALTDQELLSLRAQIRLDRSGSCPCPAASRETLDPERANYTRVAPAGELEYYPAHALVGTSTLVSIGPGVVRITDLVSGQVRSLPSAGLADAEPLDAVAFKDGVIVVSRDRSTDDFLSSARLDRITFSGQVARVDNITLPATMFRLFLYHAVRGPGGADERVFIIGEHGRDPRYQAIVSCGGEPLSCRFEQAVCPGGGLSDQGVRGLIWEEGRGGIAASTSFILQKQGIDDAWRCSDFSAITRIHTLARGPTAALVCGISETNQTQVAIASLASWPAPLEFHRVDTSTDTNACRAAWATREGFAISVEGPRGLSLLRYDPEGRRIAGPIDLRDALVGGPEEVAPLSPEILLGRDRGNGVLIGGPSAPFRRVIGEARGNLSSWVLAYADADVAWLLSGAPVVAARVDATGTSTMTPLFPSALDGLLIRSAALDLGSSPAAPRLVALTTAGPGTTPRWFELRIEGDHISEVAELHPEISDPLAIASFSPLEMAVLSGADQALVFWSGTEGSAASARRIPVNFEPTALRDPRLLMYAHGALWLRSAPDRLTRISAVRADSFDLSEQVKKGRLTTVDASCPDDVWASIDGLQTGLVNTVRITPANGSLTTLAIEESLSARMPVLNLNDTLRGALPIGASQAAVLTSGGYAYGPNGFLRRPLPTPLRQAVTRAGYLLLLGDGGRLIQGR
ncbi:MAG: hypothetical protein U1E65_28870 [Myxococcota bacterium]